MVHNRLAEPEARKLEPAGNLKAWQKPYNAYIL